MVPMSRASRVDQTKLVKSQPLGGGLSDYVRGDPPGESIPDEETWPPLTWRPKLPKASMSP